MKNLDKCEICEEETDVIFTDENGKIYCEDCWIEYESKNLMESKNDSKRTN